MLRYTITTLKKIELVYNESGYTIRYEKGHFQAGFCILQAKNVIVVNKFFDTRSRIQTLLDLVDSLSVNPDLLSSESRDFFERSIPKFIEAV